MPSPDLYIRRVKYTMAEINLNIYSKGSKKDVEKVLTAHGYDLMLGTVDDFMGIIDVDKLDDNMAVAKMVLQGYSQIKPLIMDVFPELTDDEYKRVKVNDLVQTIIQIGLAVVENLDYLKTEKN